MEGSTNKFMVGCWMRKHDNVNFYLINDSYGRQEQKVNNDELRDVVESDPSQSATKLVYTFKVSKHTIFKHLVEIHKIKKLISQYTV